jgi:hypothetical protein
MEDPDADRRSREALSANPDVIAVGGGVFVRVDPVPAARPGWTSLTITDIPAGWRQVEIVLTGARLADHRSPDGRDGDLAMKGAG